MVQAVEAGQISSFGSICGDVHGLFRFRGARHAVEDGLDDNAASVSPLFREWNVRIKEYNEKKNDPDFGKPLYYDLITTLPSRETDLDDIEVTEHGQEQGIEMRVHASRCIHVSQGLLEDDLIGPAKLFSAYNTLLDIEKILGSCAEMFWLNGRGAIVLEAKAEAQDPPEEEKEKMKEQAKDYTNSLARVLAMKGVEVKLLQHRLDSPDKHITTLIDVLSSTYGIPKRILIGSERGDLASEQDEKDWSKNLHSEIEMYDEPIILMPFIDALMKYGALTNEPNYQMVWPSIHAESANDKSLNAYHQAQALETYVKEPVAEQVVPRRQFVEDIMLMEYREDEINETPLLEIKEEEEIALIEAQEKAKPPPMAGPKAMSGQVLVNPMLSRI